VKPPAAGRVRFWHVRFWPELAGFLTMAAAKKQDFYDNAVYGSKNADSHHTISTLVVTLIVLQAIAAGGLIGVTIFLFMEGI
jgi:hypothetical protein